MHFLGRGNAWELRKAPSYKTSWSSTSNTTLKSWEVMLFFQHLNLLESYSTPPSSPLWNIQYHHAKPYQAWVLLWSMVRGLLDINMPRSSLAATNIPLALNGGGWVMVLVLVWKTCCYMCPYFKGGDVWGMTNQWGNFNLSDDSSIQMQCMVSFVGMTARAMLDKNPAGRMYYNSQKWKVECVGVFEKTLSEPSNLDLAKERCFGEL